MSIQHQRQLKKWKSWGLNSTANPTHLHHNWFEFAMLLVAPKRPWILIISFAMGADYSFYLESIAIYAPTFFKYNNSVLAIVISMPFTSIYHINLRINPWNLAKKYWELVVLKISVFWMSHFEKNCYIPIKIRHKLWGRIFIIIVVSS